MALLSSSGSLNSPLLALLASVDVSVDSHHDIQLLLVVSSGSSGTIKYRSCFACDKFHNPARSRPCQYNHYHSRCKDSEGKQGYFRLLRLPNGSTIDPMYRGYCFNTGCKFTGRLGANHKCPIEAGKKIRLKSLTPPPGFTPKKQNDVLIRKIASQSGEILGGFCGAQAEASRDFVDEASRQGITTLPKSTMNREVKKIKLSSIAAQFGKVIVGKDGLQNGSVVLGNVIYEGVPICLPTTDAVDNDDDDNDDDDGGDSSDGMKKPAASARPTKSSGSQKKLSSLLAKKPSAAPKKSDDDDDDNSNDDMKPAAVPKSSGSQMKLGFGAKKLFDPPKDSKSMSHGAKKPTVGKKSSKDATGRIDGCTCGPKSKCLTNACTCRQVDEACDPNRCKCNCEICENKGRKSSGDKGDDEGKKRQMKLSFFKKSG